MSGSKRQLPASLSNIPEQIESGGSSRRFFCFKGDYLDDGRLSSGDRQIGKIGPIRPVPVAGGAG